MSDVGDAAWAPLGNARQRKEPAKKWTAKASKTKAEPVTKTKTKGKDRAKRSNNPELARFKERISHHTSVLSGPSESMVAMCSCGWCEEVTYKNPFNDGEKNCIHYKKALTKAEEHWNSN